MKIGLENGRAKGLLGRCLLAPSTKTYQVQPISVAVWLGTNYMMGGNANQVCTQCWCTISSQSSNSRVTVVQLMPRNKMQSREVKVSAFFFSTFLRNHSIFFLTITQRHGCSFKGGDQQNIEDILLDKWSFYPCLPSLLFILQWVKATVRYSETIWNHLWNHWLAQSIFCKCTPFSEPKFILNYAQPSY